MVGQGIGCGASAYRRVLRRAVAYDQRCADLKAEWFRAADEDEIRRAEARCFAAERRSELGRRVLVRKMEKICAGALALPG